jgi:iron complex transport system ATP-binding protein
MLSAENVTHAYENGTPALQNISFTVERGRILYLLGRNGSGKTTLMGCLCGVIQPQHGTITFDNVPLMRYSAPQRAQRVGMIPQLHQPAFAYTVRDMVLMGRAPYLGLFGTPSRSDDEITDQALESVGLIDDRNRIYTQLSGGERQLVLIARGLAQQCAVLLMDEPDAHLDLYNQHQVMEKVQQLASGGLSFIVSSHLPNNALNYADSVLILKSGHMLIIGDKSATLTDETLSKAYDFPLEVVYSADGKPRAISPNKIGLI